MVRQSFKNNAANAARFLKCVGRYALKGQILNYLHDIIFLKKGKDLVCD